MPSVILGPNGKPYPKVVQPEPRALKARYDAARTTTENSNHWSNADGLSAKAANSPDVRRRLRERARYERDNNSYCSGMAETIAFDTIGTGPRLRMIGLNSNQGRRISGEFEDWMAAVGLAEKLRTFREARCIDGEGFMLLGNNPKLRTPVKLDLFGIEADQVATPDLWFSDANAVDGIKFDRYGNPTEYHLLKEHPGDLGQSAMAWGEYDRIPADVVLHWFKARRPGQLRGVPEVTPALPLYAILRRYTLATLSAAEIAAMFGVLLKSTMEASDSASPITPFSTQEFVRGMIGILPEGYEAQQVKPEHPATTYDAFEMAVLRQIARCLHIPRAIAAGDSVGLNYSSGRLDHQNYHRSIWVDRYSLETRILDRVFAAWLAEAGMVDRRLRVPGSDGAALPRHAWNWDGFKHVDPEKEANAQRQRLANGTSSPQRECAEEGYSFEETLDQIAEARKAYAERGIPYPGDPPPATPKPSGESNGDGAESDGDAESEPGPMNGHARGRFSMSGDRDTVLAAGAEPTSLSLSAAPVEIEAADAGEDGEKRRTFKIKGYTGVPMDVEGFYSPVILDLAGLKPASQTIPAFRQHDPNRIVGQTDSVKVGETAEFTGFFAGDGEDMRQIIALAKDGFKWQASVGASIERREFLESGKTATVNGRKVAGPLLIVRAGTIREISFVPLGADGQTSAAVAALASLGDPEGSNPMGFDEWLKAKGFDPAAITDIQKTFLRANFDQEQSAPPNSKAGQTAEGGSARATQSLDEIMAERRKERDRVDGITQIVARMSAERPVQLDEIERLGRAAIEAGTSVDAFELILLREMREITAGLAVRGGARQQIGPKVIEAAVARSVGLRDLEKHYDERTLQLSDERWRRGIGLKELLQVAARENGHPSVSLSDPMGLLRAAYVRANAGASTLDISSILSAVANKLIRVSFEGVESGWRRIAVIERLNDFKAHTILSLTGDLQYEKVGAGGEIPHGKLGEESYSLQANTYGKMLAITRQDITNDDLGALNRIQVRLGRGAALAINHVFWTAFLADRDTFWASGNSNVQTGGGTALQSSALKTALQTFRKQTDPDGKPLAITPKILLVPPELEITADELMTSTGVNTGGSSSTDKVPNRNVWSSKFEVVMSTYLSNTNYTGYSTTHWFLLADPLDLPTIAIGFLNGREMPVIESADADFDTLGIKFRGYHDFGVGKQEERASVRMAGA